MNKKSLLRLMKLVIVMAAVLLAMMPVSAMADDGGTVDKNGMSEEEGTKFEDQQHPVEGLRIRMTHLVHQYRQTTDVFAIDETCEQHT